MPGMRQRGRSSTFYPRPENEQPTNTQAVSPEFDLGIFRATYPGLVPYARVRYRGQQYEAISYPWPESVGARINIRKKGDPCSMEAVNASEVTPLVGENRIISVLLQLDLDSPNGTWTVETVKEFAPENGGGVQTFKESAGNVHHALDVARGMCTVSPGQRTDYTLPESPLNEVVYLLKTWEAAKFGRKWGLPLYSPPSGPPQAKLTLEDSIARYSNEVEIDDLTRPDLVPFVAEWLAKWDEHFPPSGGRA